MSLVLVTGANGFIGRHLVEALVRRGDRVRCLIRPVPRVDRLRELDVELVTADLDDRAALKFAAAGADVVFHLAGLIRALHIDEFYKVNQYGTARLAEACVALPTPPRLVVVSSVAAAGPAPRGQIRIESDPPAPVSHYGRSKLAAEEEAARFAAALRLTIVRPGIVFGPRDRAFIQILKSIRTFRCHLSPGISPPALSCIHVSDLVELLLRAEQRGQTVPARESEQPGRGRYFAVAPEYPTYAELGRLVRPMLRRPYAPIIPVPAPLAYCVGGVNEIISRLRGKPEELCVDKIRDALVPSWACSGEAARRDLGFLPAKPLAQRLQETVEWGLSNGCI